MTPEQETASTREGMTASLGGSANVNSDLLSRLTRVQISGGGSKSLQAPTVLLLSVDPTQRRNLIGAPAPSDRPLVIGLREPGVEPRRPVRRWAATQKVSVPPVLRSNQRSRLGLGLGVLPHRTLASFRAEHRRRAPRRR